MPKPTHEKRGGVSATVASAAPEASAWGAAYDACRTEAAIRMGRFFIGHLMRLYREFDGDLEQVILLGEIGHHNTSSLRFSAEGSVIGRGPDGTAPRLHPCNAFSLSQATGVPRETVRRKLAELTRRGWVRRNERGEFFVTPEVAAHFMPVFNRATLEDLFAVSAELEAMLRGAAAAQAVKTNRGRAGR